MNADKEFAVEPGDTQHAEKIIIEEKSRPILDGEDVIIGRWGTVQVVTSEGPADSTYTPDERRIEPGD